MIKESQAKSHKKVEKENKPVKRKVAQKVANPEVPEEQTETATIAETAEIETESPQDIEAINDRHWYVIHTFAGYENKVKADLEKRIESMGMKDKIFQVLIPMEEELEIKGGKKRVIQKKIFPGYVLVEMIMSNDSWYVVRNTSGVTGFVGSGTKPTPLPENEVKSILKQIRGEAPRPKVALSVGTKVRIISGPFAEFYGMIQEVNTEKEKVKILISIFGRETPVELDFTQVEKL